MKRFGFIIRNFSRSNVCETKDRLVLECKNQLLNHYSGTQYIKLDQIPLASKGWNHKKSIGDHFTIRPRLLEATKDPMISFDSLGIKPPLCDALKSVNVFNLTTYQAEAWRLVTLPAQHLQLTAETGCGKTLAYLLPIIQHLADTPKATDALNTPRLVVLVPNRELAHQVGETARILSESVGLKTQVIVGGQTKKIMMDPEFQDVDVLVGTPGVIGKLSTVGVYRLGHVLFTVLDEADTLMDDSFQERIGGIAKRMAQSKLILVSATEPRTFPDILKPIEANLKELSSPDLHRPLVNVTQDFFRVSRSAKPSRLLQLTKVNKYPMIVFTNRNRTCNWAALFLRENGVLCSNINGDQNYAIRIHQWNQFIRGDTNILVATDVGSRGLDTTQVRHVVNYDFPLYAADYLHRVGRVGRLGSRPNCRATNLISGSEEVKLVQQIELAVRTNEPLSNVDGNITNIVQRKIIREMRQTA